MKYYMLYIFIDAEFELIVSQNDRGIMSMLQNVNKTSLSFFHLAKQCSYTTMKWMNAQQKRLYERL